MISLILFSIALLILLPLAVAFVEGHKRQLNPADDGYWTLARALLGGCHLRWSPDPTPIVWFDIGDGQGRIHTYQSAGEDGWWLEGRVYMKRPCLFAARLCIPPQPPLNPTLNQMNEIRYSKEKNDDLLKRFSFETSHTKRFEAWITTDSVREALSGIQSNLPLEKTEILITSQIIIIRGCGHVQNDQSPGELVERLGLQLSQAMRELFEGVGDFIHSARLKNSDELEVIDPVTGRPITGEPWSCSKCGQRQEWNSMEIIRGCSNPECTDCIDGISYDVLKKSRPLIYITEDGKEIDIFSAIDELEVHEVPSPLSQTLPPSKNPVKQTDLPN